MTELYLIRHTEAEGNLFRAMQGHWDGDVTALGLREIDALAERFAPIRLNAVYASDLKRARLTAGALLRGRTLTLQTRRELREINVGPWETRFFGDVAHEQPEEMELFIHRPEEFALEGAERYDEVRRRAFAAIEEIARANEGGTVGVVSHGVTIRCILSQILGLRLDDPAVTLSGNTGVSRLIWENGAFRVDYMNDCSHLDSRGIAGLRRTLNLRAEPLDLRREADYYRAAYADAWLSAHGSLALFSPEPYLASAREHAAEDPGSVLRILDGDTPCGLVELDLRRGARDGCGWISLLWLDGAYRGRALGVQLLGRALMRYQALGRRAVRLHAAEDNDRALRFYEKHGFRRLSSEKGAFGKLYLMEYRFGESHV